MTQFLTVADVVQLHDMRVPEAALIDERKLDAALARPKNAEAYDAATIHEMAGVLFEGIIQAHAFEDGNKRTAVLAVASFYAMNCYELMTGIDGELVHLAVGIVTGDADARKAADMFSLWADQAVLIDAEDIEDVPETELPTEVRVTMRTRLGKLLRLYPPD